MQTQTEQGVTLLELMIVVAIIGIITMLAVPGYQSQIHHSRRDNGITQLLQLHIQQEAFRITQPQYATALQLGMPNSEYYSFTVENISAVTFTLSATAINSQTQDRECTTLSINQSMIKVPQSCWL
ncbi:MAG: type IV pilus assembly protein PilE [Paraglaciecola sp.]|jgi:type IV pilus assembly protein PilE